MRKNLLKKTLLVLTVSGLVLTMAACKDKDTDTSEPSTQEAVENTTEQEDNASTEQAAERTTESRARKDDTEEATEETTEAAKNTNPSGSRTAQTNTASNPGRTSAAGQSNSNQADNTPIGDASQAFDNTNTTTPPADNTNTSSGSNNTTPSTPAQHTHTWVAVTETVNHPEEGHYEKVEIAPEFTQPKYELHTICHVCGFDYTANQTKPGQHTCPGTDTFGTYGGQQVQVGTITTPAIYEDQWVVDKAAWTETVTTGYKCSTCGETKSN